MRRFLYGALIALHPPRFRERFGDEMMCVFDEARGERTARLFADGVLSLARQWLLRSNLWKMTTGAVVSGLLLCGWGYAFTQGTNTSLERELQVMAGNPAFHRAPDSFDENEFSREAAQAISILAEIRKTEARKQQAQSHDSPQSPPFTR